jgi:hypothetical protein
MLREGGPYLLLGRRKLVTDDSLDLRNRTNPFKIDPDASFSRDRDQSEIDRVRDIETQPTIVCVIGKIRPPVETVSERHAPRVAPEIPTEDHSQRAASSDEAGSVPRAHEPLSSDALILREFACQKVDLFASWPQGRAPDIHIVHRCDQASRHIEGAER